MIIEYDGTRYHGFQRQRNAPTIQENIEDALERLTGEKLRIIGASRTDAGAHARGQVISFRPGAVFPRDTWVKAMNYYLHALEVRPNLAEAHVNVANILLSNNMVAGAIEHLNKALKLAEAQNRKKLADAIQSRLDLYKASRPYVVPQSKESHD